MYVNICRGVFITQLNIHGGAFLQKSQKSFNLDAQLGSKYVSGIDFRVEQVYRMSIFICYNQLPKTCDCVLVPPVNKTCWFNLKSVTFYWVFCCC